MNEEMTAQERNEAEIQMIEDPELDDRMNAIKTDIPSNPLTKDESITSRQNIGNGIVEPGESQQKLNQMGPQDKIDEAFEHYKSAAEITLQIGRFPYLKGVKNNCFQYCVRWWLKETEIRLKAYKRLLRKTG